MIIAAKWVVILFGIFFIVVGILMFTSTQKIILIIKKAGTTNWINYSEITIRMIPAAGLIIYSNHSLFPILFKIMGWFMIATSLVLFFVSKEKHHKFANKYVGLIKPDYFKILAPITILIGCFFIYAV